MAGIIDQRDDMRGLHFGLEPMDIIDQIEEIRRQNNTKWMEMLRLAVEVAPERAKEIIKVINQNDLAISQLLSELAK